MYILQLNQILFSLTPTSAWYVYKLALLSAWICCNFSLHDPGISSHKISSKCKMCWVQVTKYCKYFGKISILSWENIDMDCIKIQNRNEWCGWLRLFAYEHTWRSSICNERTFVLIATCANSAKNVCKNEKLI